MPPCASSSAPTLRGGAVDRLRAEQLDLHALGRDRGGVEHDERPGGARRQLVDRARDQFLAGAGRAGDHDAAVGRRDLLDHLAEMVHRRPRRRASSAASPARSRSALTSRRSLRGFQRALGDQHQAVGLERLLDVVVGAALDRRDRGLDVAVAGDHHHRQVGMLALDRVEQRQAVQPAALQPDVEEDQGRPPLARSRRARCRRRGRARAVAFVARMPATSSRMSASSSTMRMSDAMLRRLRYSAEQLRRPRGASAVARPSRARGSVIRISAPLPPSPPPAHRAVRSPAVLLHDLCDDREAEAGALLARRHVGLEQPLAVFLRQADAVVHDIDDDRIVLGARRRP